MASSLAGKTIVVTGAAGFIGRRVVARLGETGATIVAVDCAPKPAGFPDSVVYQRMHLSEQNEMPSAAALIHLAWNMDRANTTEQSRAVADFSQLLAAAEWTHVIGLGSAEEYGACAGRLTEDMAPGPALSAYGAAKHAACRALQAWADGPTRKGVWLRPFVVYGAGQGGNMAIPYALRCARERKPADFSEGIQFRDFVHVDDVADGIIAALTALPTWSNAFTACNLGRGEPVRLREILERIAANTGAQDLFRFGTRAMRPGEPPVQYAATDISTSFGWHAKIPWQCGMDWVCKQEVDAHG